MSTDPIRHALVTSDALSRRVSEYIGRLMDLSVAACAFVFLAPLLLLISLALLAAGDGPILFLHERIGRSGQRFKVVKFRTMAVDASDRLRRHLDEHEAARLEWDADHKLRQDPRVSPLGAFLRKSSLDELPQLYNVLRGDMSIVGPRPIVEAEMPRYGAHISAYCSVRPGITGIWQVSGRNDISYVRRVEMDALYARKKSVLLDLRIIIATVPAVLLRRGSY